MLAVLGLVLADRWDEVRGQLVLVSTPALAGAFAYALLALAAGLLAWRALLADLGSPLPLGAAGRELFGGRLAGYLPGRRRPGTPAEPRRGPGVPRGRAAAARLLLHLVAVGVGVVLVLAALPSLLGDGAPGWLRWTPALIPVGLAGLTPPALTALSRLLRRPPDGRLSWTRVGTAVLALLGTWLAYGLHVTLLGWSLGADPAALLLPATGAFAAAWCTGFLLPAVPAGVGVREVVLVLVLAGQLPGGSAAALTVAVLSRLLLTVAAATALVGTAVGGRRTAADPAPAAPPAPPGPGSAGAAGGAAGCRPPASARPW